jgi:hypothetical protein
VNHATRLAGLELALDLDQGSVGGIETPREEHRHVEQGSRIIGEQACRVGDVELRGLQGADVRRVGLIQQHG